ncbi:Uncharacterised protein [Mycobacteroides abscessus subsp. abscessus]|nr:Uncharacterised protein [Mycobacteroides abscessus subsp. abscessus]
MPKPLWLNSLNWEWVSHCKWPLVMVEAFSKCWKTFWRMFLKMKTQMHMIKIQVCV